MKQSWVSRKKPRVRNILLLANIAVFLYCLSLSPEQLQTIVARFGFLPSFFFNNPPAHLYAFVSYQFLHGGLGHLLGNMLYLWAFGDNVEARLGSLKFFVFYLVAGFISCMVQILALPHASIPLVGASGSIAGVLGIYAALFPKAKVVTWVSVWFLYQFVLGYATYNPYASSGGVAWWAHIGGFIFGLLFGLSTKR